METRVTKISKIIETLPVGGLQQGQYSNCVIEIQTNLSPYVLLRRLQKIEADLGRVRVIKNGPRNIDLDILLFGNVKISEDSLCIPHPRMFNRDFVMKPLEEIAPMVVRKLKRVKRLASKGAKKKR